MDKKIYYVSPLTWIITLPFLVLTAFTLFCFMMVTPSILTIENPFYMLFSFLGIIFLTFFVMYAALLFFDIPTMRLEISDEGVILYSNGYRIYTPWNNIRGVGKSRYGAYRPQALLLQELAVKGSVRGDGSQLERATIERRRWLTTKKDPSNDAIPLLFTVPANWQESELGLYIKQYAPQAFYNQAELR